MAAVTVLLDIATTTRCRGRPDIAVCLSNKKKKEGKKKSYLKVWSYLSNFFGGVGLLIFYIKADSLEYFIFLMKREVKFHNFLWARSYVQVTKCYELSMENDRNFRHSGKDGSSILFWPFKARNEFWHDTRAVRCRDSLRTWTNWSPPTFSVGKTFFFFSI